MTIPGNMFSYYSRTYMIVREAALIYTYEKIAAGAPIKNRMEILRYFHW